MGEALGLHWQDVDLDAGIVSVRQALGRSGGDGVNGFADFERNADVMAMRRDISRTILQSRAVIVEAREALRNAATVVGRPRPLCEYRSAGSWRALLQLGGLLDR